MALNLYINLEKNYLILIFYLVLLSSDQGGWTGGD